MAGRRRSLDRSAGPSGPRPTRSKEVPARVESFRLGSTARWKLLSAGYSEPRVASSISLVQDGQQNIVIDPGMVRDTGIILRALARASVTPDRVSDVILSHHHPDHTLNAGLFRRARVHDHWAIYRHDEWTSRPAEGFHVAPSVLLLATPGHTLEDITTVVGTDLGPVAFTHLWWDRGGPREDPVAEVPRRLHAQRRRVLRFAARIVPGHGRPFTPDPSTPR